MTRKQVLEILENNGYFSKDEKGVYYYNDTTVEITDYGLLATFFKNNNCIGGASLIFENITSLKIYKGFMVDNIVFAINGVLYYLS